MSSNYAELAKKYPGKYALIVDEKVIFVDENFKLVMEEFEKLGNKDKVKITFLDDGEATFYEISI